MYLAPDYNDRCLVVSGFHANLLGEGYGWQEKTSVTQAMDIIARRW